MDTSFHLPNEYSNTDFTLYKELAVNESIAEDRNLFNTIKISYDGIGNIIEGTPFVFVQQDLDGTDQHKLESCIPLNNKEHEKAWRLFLFCNKKNYNDITESGNNMIRYCDSVLHTYEAWFNENGYNDYLKIKRLIHNDDFRSVKLGDTTFSLTESQSIVIKYLYALLLQGVPQTKSSTVIQHLDEMRGVITTSNRLVDVFKNNKIAYKTLIKRKSDLISINIT